MKMAGRIRAAWAALAGRLPSGRLDGAPALRTFQTWLREDLPAVSRRVAEALPGARGIALVAAAEWDALPLTRGTLAGFAAALRAAPPVDPGELVRHVDAMCWDLLLVRHPEDTCPACQGDLSVWASGAGAIFARCDLLGCCFDAAGRLCAPPADLRPATRAELLAAFPDAPLGLRP